MMGGVSTATVPTKTTTMIAKPASPKVVPMMAIVEQSQQQQQQQAQEAPSPPMSPASIWQSSHHHQTPINSNTHPHFVHQQKQQLQNLQMSEHEELLHILSQAKDINDKKARMAVRYALTHCEKLDRYDVDRVLGYGSNGVGE
jgi:hypothetical protein